MKLYTLTCLALAAAFPVGAARLDDSLSPRQNVDVIVDWRYSNNLENLDEEKFNALHSVVRNFEVRLNTAQHTGKQARVYLGLPVVIRGLDDPSGMRLSWTTRGVFSDGTVTPGTRSLLFDGIISSAVLIDILDFTIEIDGRSFINPITFEPEYEIETVTP
ncbi:MAG: hypothetical protein KJO10_07305 [Gammaproteobacteria bacterium]|nr:hypothetical protein [Gammaproteobacteria bacterium]